MVSKTFTYLEQCIKIFDTIIGLLCKYAIQEFIFYSNNSFWLKHIHIQWHLEKELLKVVVPILKLLIQELMKVHSKKCLNNLHNTFTIRNLSQFEVTEEIARERQYCRQREKILQANKTQIKDEHNELVNKQSQKLPGSITLKISSMSKQMACLIGVNLI